MLELTDAARKELEAYFTDKERGNIRIYLAQGG
jgi:Fe-S cluster assembly iron-binding protein IscA